MLQLLHVPRLPPDAVPGAAPRGGRGRGLHREAADRQDGGLPGQCAQGQRLLGGDDPALQLPDGQTVQAGQQQVRLKYFNQEIFSK